MSDDGVLLNECLLPISVKGLSGEEAIVFIDVLGGLAKMMLAVRTQFQLNDDSTFDLFWAGEKVTNNILKGLSSDDVLTIGELCYAEELETAIKFADLDTLARLQIAGVSFSSQIPGTDNYPLLLALRNTESLKFLCETGMDLNQKFGDNQETALHVACLNRLGEATKMLLAFKADPAARDRLGNTPLHMIALVGSPQLLVDYLNHCGLNFLDPKVNALNNNAIPPIYVACARDHDNGCAIVTILCKHGASCSGYGPPPGASMQMRQCMRTSHLSHLEDSSVSKQEYPELRSSYRNDTCDWSAKDTLDPSTLKVLDRTWRGSKLPRTRKPKSTYGRSRLATPHCSFVAKESKFRDSERVSGISFASIVSKQPAGTH